MTIILANLNRLLQFLCHFNREEILHATIIKFIASPDLCTHLTVCCKLDQSVVNHAIDEWRRRLSACLDRRTFLNITYDCYSQNNNDNTVNLIIADAFFCSFFVVNVNEQRIITF